MASSTRGADGTTFFTETGAGDVLFASSAELLHFPSLRGTCRAIQQLYDAELHHLWHKLQTHFASKALLHSRLGQAIVTIDKTEKGSIMDKFRCVSTFFEEQGVNRGALWRGEYLPCYIKDIRRLQEESSQVRALPLMWHKIQSTQSPVATVAMQACTTVVERRAYLADPTHQAALTAIATYDFPSVPLYCIPCEMLRFIGLQELNLSYNQLTALPKDIGELAQLQRCDLSCNQLTALPETFGNLHLLQWLDLTSNSLGAASPETFPIALCNLIALLDLSLHGNQLGVLPEDMGNLTNLQNLKISCNRLDALPKTLGNLTNLQRFECDQNCLTSLPSTFFQLTSLHTLHLDHNNLTILSAAIENLTRLQELHLRGNKLSALPATIGALSELHELFLCSNQLTTLPKTVGELSRLHTLRLNANPLIALPEEFTQLHWLRQLEMEEHALLFTFDKEWHKKGWAESGRYFFRTELNKFINYRCQSSLAAFYRKMGLTGEFILTEFHSQVPEKEQELIYQLVCTMAEKLGRVIPPSHSRSDWGRQHVFDVPRRFCLALQQSITQKYDNLPPEERARVQHTICVLASQADGLTVMDSPWVDEPNWGKDHALDRPLILIDAMHQHGY